MNDLTTQPPKLSIAYSANAELTIELAKMLTLVAPTSMTTEQQELFLRAAADSLDGIRAAEVQAISQELRRRITRPSQIVPTIADLVSEKRKRSADQPVPARAAAEVSIDREARDRRGKAKSQAEVEEAWKWEREARKQAGLHVPPIGTPLTARELETMPAHIRKMGINCGFLEYRDGKLCELQP